MAKNAPTTLHLLTAADETLKRLTDACRHLEASVYESSEVQEFLAYVAAPLKAVLEHVDEPECAARERAERAKNTAANLRKEDK